MGAVGPSHPVPALAPCEEGGPLYENCFGYPSAALHCRLEVLRDHYRAGHLDEEDLPDWTILEQRDGAPIIFDLRTRNPEATVVGFRS